MRKQRTHTCPECGRGFFDRELVAIHALLMHLDFRPLCPSLRSPTCWCGKGLVGPWSAWPPPDAGELFAQADLLLAHCDRHGGMQAHYTAALLGID